jgi:hypothetical protein
MKKLVVSLVCVLSVIALAHADVYTWSGTVTNGQAATATQLQVSGLLDKIELYNSDKSATSTVVVATYDIASGTTISNTIETYATCTLTAATKLIRPRMLPTDNTGTALTAATNGVGITATMLTVPYAQPVIGGNVCAVIASGGMGSSVTNTVTIKIFYDTLRR